VGRVLHIWGMWGTAEPNFGRAAGADADLAGDCRHGVLNLWQIG
jgi:hypothetical protein